MIFHPSTSVSSIGILGEALAFPYSDLEWGCKFEGRGMSQGGDETSCGASLRQHIRAQEYLFVIVSKLIRHIYVSMRHEHGTEYQKPFQDLQERR